MKTLIRKIRRYMIQRRINMLLLRASDMRARALEYAQTDSYLRAEAQRTERDAYALMREHGILRDDVPYALQNPPSAPYKIELRTTAQIDREMRETCF